MRGEQAGNLSLTGLDVKLGAGKTTLNLAGNPSHSVNATGTAVGGYGAKTEHSFVRSADGTITLFDTKGASWSDAVCINDDGWIAGD